MRIRTAAATLKLFSVSLPSCKPGKLAPSSLQGTFREKSGHSLVTLPESYRLVHLMDHQLQYYSLALAQASTGKSRNSLLLTIAHCPSTVQACCLYLV